MEPIVEFGMLGPVVATVDGREVRIGGPRARAVLAALLLDADRVVPVDTVVATAWGAEAPETARFQAQNRISRLRRALRDAGGGDVIQTAGAGYIIRLTGPLDTRSFDTDVRQARSLEAAGDLDGAAGVLTRALQLWRGPALHGLSTPRLQAVARRLDEARLSVQELLVDIDLRCGRHHEVIGSLLDLTAAHPWRETVVAKLILALYRSGQRREALAAYERTHRSLADELGIDPGQDLIRIRDRVLRDDPTLLAAGGPVGVQLLPRPVPHFVGRRQALDALDALAANSREAAVCTIAGPAGVGKTALAAHWAHRTAAGRDGRLFVNLRAHEPGTPLAPYEALVSLLLGMGIAFERLPHDEAAAVAMYRAFLATRRVVVVLDDAADADQVRPLLPPGPGSVAVVTSRERLTILTALEGAMPISLAALAEEDAVELLRRLIGAERIGRDHADLVALARTCGGSPVALRIAAARLAERPGRLRDYLAHLDETRKRRDCIHSDRSEIDAV